MSIQIDPQSSVPLYQQLRDRTIDSVASGELDAEQQLASVRQVASAFGINVATVGKAYDLLRAEGVIRTNRKSRSVIVRSSESGEPTPGFISQWRPRLRTLLAEGVVHGVGDDQIAELAVALLEEFAALRATNSSRGKEKEEFHR